MENWILIIETVVIFSLFAISANITISRLALPLPAANEETGFTAMDIQHEIRLTYLSAMTSIVFMALFSWLAIQFFIP